MTDTCMRFTSLRRRVIGAKAPRQPRVFREPPTSVAAALQKIRTRLAAGNAPVGQNHNRPSRIKAPA
ncbi:MAG: hypothetical protein HYZ62_01640 [Candidatus Andersenbacteria bacterium]|nr:hypothetical protein [Candidatus Andersenbacteria bacterium]